MSASFSFQRGHLILPPVIIEHIFPVAPSMVLDTGARFTMITPGLAQELGVEFTGHERRLQVIGITGSAQAALVSLKRVTLLGLSIENHQALCHPLPERLGLDGILGLNFLEHFNLTIDHDSEKINLVKRNI